MAPSGMSAGPKPKMVRVKRAQPSVFHQSLKRGVLTLLAPNTVSNRVDKAYDVVKPTFTSYKASVQMKGPRGSTRFLKKKVPAPKELWEMRPLDQAAISKPLMDLMEKELAEKKEKERAEREAEDSPLETNGLEVTDLQRTRSDVLDLVIDWSKGDNLTLPPSLAHLVGLHLDGQPDSLT